MEDSLAPEREQEQRRWASSVEGQASVGEEEVWSASRGLSRRRAESSPSRDSEQPLRERPQSIAVRVHLDTRREEPEPGLEPMCRAVDRDSGRQI